MIPGTTNNSTFSCDFDIDRLKGPIPVNYEKIGGKYIFKKAILVFNKQGFDCGVRGVSRDFHDLLKSGKYPRILLKSGKSMGIYYTIYC
ncbi:hypothetical protein DHD08_02835 [Arenibacter sp. H213]|nr:hypothetical protein [Arenibacter sp. H213]